MRLRLTPGQRRDIIEAPALIDGVDYDHLIADCAFDTDDFIALILAQNAIPVIPSRFNCRHPREFDTYLYSERHLVECFINKIKHYRHIFSRFDKLDICYLGLLAFVAVLIWLR